MPKRPPDTAAAFRPSAAADHPQHRSSKEGASDAHHADNSDRTFDHRRRIRHRHRRDRQRLQPRQQRSPRTRLQPHRRSQLATPPRQPRKPSPPSARWTRKRTPRFLEAIADNIEAIGDELIDPCDGQETGLPAARLNGERGRTTGQLRLFAARGPPGRLPRRPDRSGPAGPHADAARRHPPAPDPAGPGRRLRREQLPAGLLDGRRRHRLGPRRRLPGGLQGPQRPPGHQRTRRPGHRQGRRATPACTPACSR